MKGSHWWSFGISTVVTLGVVYAVLNVFILLVYLVTAIWIFIPKKLSRDLGMILGTALALWLYF